MKQVNKLVYMALFIAMEVILTRFLSIQTPIVRIGFTFLPVALSAMLFGPLYSGVAAALADVIGMMLFPTGGAFFPGFTLSAFLTGAVYGIFLYNHEKTFFRVSLAVVVITLVIDLGMNSVWLWMITGRGILAILPTRVVKSAIMVPIQISLIQVVWRYLGSYAYRWFIPSEMKS